MTGALAADAGPVPMALVATTVNVYVVPLVRPAMVCVVAVEANTAGAWAAPAMEGVTTYPVTTDPPLDAGAVGDGRLAVGGQGGSEWARPGASHR